MSTAAQDLPPRATHVPTCRCRHHTNTCQQQGSTTYLDTLPTAHKTAAVSQTLPPACLPVVAAPHGDVRPAEGHQRRQRRQPARVGQVALVVQHVHVHAQVPHLAACRTGGLGTDVEVEVECRCRLGEGREVEGVAGTALPRAGRTASVWGVPPRLLPRATAIASRQRLGPEKGGGRAGAARTCQHHQRLQIHGARLTQPPLHQASHLYRVLPRTACRRRWVEGAAGEEVGSGAGAYATCCCAPLAIRAHLLACWPACHCPAEPAL